MPFLHFESRSLSRADAKKGPKLVSGAVQCLHPSQWQCTLLLAGLSHRQRYQPGAGFLYEVQDKFVKDVVGF